MNNIDRNKLIKTEMVLQDYSQEKLAERLGITRNSVSRKLLGKYYWTVNEVEKLAEIFGKERTYFF